MSIYIRRGSTICFIFLSVRALPKNATFLPYTIAQWYSIESLPYKIDKKIKILHAPSNRSAKGSSYILQALEKLQTRYDFEIILVENLPHTQALELYKQADLVLDQILIGWYGAFAVEAMKMGKPVAVFIREEDLQFIPKEMARDLKDAVIYITHLNIEEILEHYLQNPSLLIQKSQAALEYVHKWHDPIYVAGITQSIYER